jgi:hypothetical protein
MPRTVDNTTTRKRAILARCRHTAANASHLQSGNPKRSFVTARKRRIRLESALLDNRKCVRRAPTHEPQARLTLAKTWD